MLFTKWLIKRNCTGEENQPTRQRNYTHTHTHTHTHTKKVIKRERKRERKRNRNNPTFVTGEGKNSMLKLKYKHKSNNNSNNNRKWTKELSSTAGEYFSMSKDWKLILFEMKWWKEGADAPRSCGFHR